ncbi:succinate dehydrogenase assembly factor 2 [Lacibacterium aquatile]|uniref:FAD assembly factor SdhE n=1 Tax=Lacibacterium aquatile TaxID=1168082 RepID=A0ABW5DQ25_9PROT
MEVRRKRLLFQAHHRGSREADILIGRFADAEVPGMTEAEMTAFELMLDLPDIDLVNWVMGRTVPPPEDDTPILRRLIAFHAKD